MLVVFQDKRSWGTMRMMAAKRGRRNAWKVSIKVGVNVVVFLIMSRGQIEFDFPSYFSVPPFRSTLLL